jgi:hypothetical protein
MPSEPAESNFKNKVRTVAYPTQERGGMVWIYMGPRAVPPPLPELEVNMLPEGYYQIGSYSSECNWLQSQEGDYDTIHLGFLHQGSIRPEDLTPGSLEYYVVKTRWARMATEDTEFGCTYGCNRPTDDGNTYWRIAHFLFPFYAMIPTLKLGDKKTFIVVVPVDDENCLRFTLTETRPGQGVAPAALVNGVTTGYHSDPSRNGTGWLDRFNLAGNVRNDYLIDRDVQRANEGPLGYSGIPGRGQDGAVTESMGVIYQRDNEHLGVTDAGIIRMRRLLIRATKALRDEGTIPPGVDNPQVYKVRSGGIILPNGVSGIEATKDLQWKALTEEPIKATT